MAIGPLEIGVCSWSLQVKSVAELRKLLDRLGTSVVQIACGDPHHAAWEEEEHFPEVARAAGFRMTGAMLGFPGEDYTTPQTIQRTGGFADPATRAERLERFGWALEDTLAKVSNLARSRGVTVAFETGQETADLLRLTLDELRCPNLKVNFDPANMLLYDKGDPLRAVEILGPDIRSVHVKDANRPKLAGTWGEEVPLGKGQVNIRQFIKTLQKVGYRGPLCIEREVGNQEERLADVAHGIRYLGECLAD